MGTPRLKGARRRNNRTASTGRPVATLTAGALAGGVLRWLRMSPATYRVISLVLSLAVPAVVTLGVLAPSVGAVLVGVSAVAGTLDGQVAVSAGRLTRLGMVFDPVVDRICELCWLLALWLLGAPAWVVVTGGIMTGLYEYIRARAVMVGMPARGVVTVGGRGARILIMIVGLAVAGLGSWATEGFLAEGFATGLVTMIGVLWVLLGLFGLCELLLEVHDTLR